MAKRGGLKKIFSNAQPYFFMMRGEGFDKLKLVDVGDDWVVIELPVGAPMRKSMVGIIPTTDGSGVYEVDGSVETELAPGQPQDTIRLMLDPSKVRKVDRRGFPRVSFTPPLEAEVRAADSDEAIPARVINMSAGGLRVETAGELPADRFLTFRFDLMIDDEVHEMALEGRIVYEIPFEGYRAYGVALGRGEDDETLPEDEGLATDAERTVDLMNLVNRLLVRQ